jgi:transposase-like protein
MNKYSNSTKLEAQQMYAMGQSFTEISRKIGCHRTTVGVWAKNGGWKSSRIQANPELDAFAVKLASCHTYIKIKVLNEVSQNMLLTGCKVLEETDETRVRQACRLVLQACKYIKSQQEAVNHTKFIIELAIVLQKRVTDKTLLSSLQDELIEVYDNYDHY